MKHKSTERLSMANEEWFYFKGDQKVGPITAVQLRQLANSGQVVPDDRIIKQGWNEERLAGSISGLFKQEAATTTSPQIELVQSKAIPFADWYRERWMSSLRWFYQAPIWIVYGFVWIPLWYIATATPSGSIRQRWVSLSSTDKAVSCLPLLLFFILQGGSKNVEEHAPQNEAAMVLKQTPITEPASRIDKEKVKSVDVKLKSEDKSKAVGSLNLTGWFSDSKFIDFLDHPEKYQNYDVTVEAVYMGKNGLENWMEDRKFAANVDCPFDLRRLIDGNMLNAKIQITIPSESKVVPIRSFERAKVTFRCTQGSLRHGNYSHSVVRP